MGEKEFLLNFVKLESNEYHSVNITEAGRGKGRAVNPVTEILASG